MSEWVMETWVSYDPMPGENESYSSPEIQKRSVSPKPAECEIFYDQKTHCNYVKLKLGEIVQYAPPPAESEISLIGARSNAAPSKKFSFSSSSNFDFVTPPLDFSNE